MDFRFDPLDAVGDVSVLRIAASEGRILVSHDFRTMPTAFAEYRREANSPGVLLAPQLWPLGDIIERLVLVWELSEAEEWQNRILLPAYLGRRPMTRRIFVVLSLSSPILRHLDHIL